MRKNKFFEEIRQANLEREVELVYKKELNYYYPDVVISNPYGCDGLIEKGNLKLIIELKYSEEFTEKRTQCKVIVQALYYIKKFQCDGYKLPNVILIGDKDEVFTIHNNAINKYIDEDIDWSIAPSKAGLKNPELILKMVKDDDIIPHIFKIDESFSFKQVVDYINSLVSELKTYVTVTERNISSIYDYFTINVIKNYKQHSSNELVKIFITFMINPEGTYLHPNKKNVLVLQDGKEVSIKRDRYLAFFNYFKREYSPKEKEKFTEIADRLIEDTIRRAKGEYYTPTNWVDEAHTLISNILQEDWKNNYVVWDCAWGTGNLTRDYYFSRLYCSTIHHSDLTIGYRYNKNAVKFQYDFLSDDTELLEGKDLLTYNLKLPKVLLEDLRQNKPILFLINPPYGSAGTMKTDGSHKKGIVGTRVNLLMKKYNMGACSQQLYAQFLFRILLMKQIYNLTNVSIALFASPLFMTGSSFKKFRELFLKNFKYETGMLFPASEFDGVCDEWGISFSVWTSGKTADKNTFKHVLKQISISDTLGINKIITLGYKELYNLDSSGSFSDWIKEDVKNLKTYEAPLLSSALVVKESGYGRLAKDAFGYYVNSGNSIYDNASDVYLLSGCSTRGHGISVMPSNFIKVMANFAARKCMIGQYSDWKNNKDEYMVPNTTDKRYIDWAIDCIVYSLFHSASNQSSLRNIKYKGSLYNIENEFFFMSNSKMRELANKYNNDEVYLDAKSFSRERYVYKFLSETKLSNESLIVLNKAKRLIEKSFEYRQVFNEDHPEYNINTWDAGWYQIKGILKEYFTDDLEDFNYLYRILDQKIRSMIYKLGILR
jgi:hypothetical protein